jgi:hypothetical protein
VGLDAAQKQPVKIVASGSWLPASNPNKTPVTWRNMVSADLSDRGEDDAAMSVSSKKLANSEFGWFTAAHAVDRAASLIRSRSSRTIQAS